MVLKISGVTPITNEDGETFIELNDDVKRALDVMATFTQNDINRHLFLPKLRNAGACVEKGEFKATSTSGQEKEMTRSLAIMEKVKADVVFDLLDFMPGITTRWPKDLAPFKAQAEMELEKLMADEDRLAAATEKLGREPTALDIAEKLKAIYASQPEVNFG